MYYSSHQNEDLYQQFIMDLREKISCYSFILDLSYYHTVERVAFLTEYYEPEELIDVLNGVKGLTLWDYYEILEAVDFRNQPEVLRADNIYIFPSTKDKTHEEKT